MRSLRVLDMSYEMLTGTIPTSLGSMGNLTSLTLSLSLSSSWLSASIPSELAKLDYLVFAKALSMRHKIVWNGHDSGDDDDKPTAGVKLLHHPTVQRRYRTSPAESVHAGDGTMQRLDRACYVPK